MKIRVMVDVDGVERKRAVCDLGAGQTLAEVVHELTGQVRKEESAAGRQASLFDRMQIRFKEL